MNIIFHVAELPENEDAWIATLRRDMGKSDAWHGYGDTAWDAIEDLCRRLRNARVDCEFWQD